MQVGRPITVIGGKPDIARTGRDVQFWPVPELTDFGMSVLIELQAIDAAFVGYASAIR